MSLFRRLLLRSSPPFLRLLALPLSRHFAFSSAEEAAAERRRRKRRLRIEPPLHALRRDPRPPRDPNAPRLPDSTSSLVGPRLNLHNRVQSLIRSHDLDSASAAARHAVFSSTRPTVFTCNAVIAAMYRARRYDDACALFRFFFEQCSLVPNVVSYNFLIVSLCDSARVDDALAVYRRILDSAPFSPSHVTYRHLTRGLVAASRLPDAVAMLREMITRGHGADSLVFNNVISGFLERDDLPRALELFDELRERCLVYDGTVTATFMDWYFRRDRPRDAMDAYRALLDKQFDMIPATCNALLEVLLRHSRQAEADRLFDSLLSKHAPPRVHALTTDTYNVMVNAQFTHGDPEGAIEVFRRTGAKPLAMDVTCFNNIIGKLLEHGLPDRALELFEDMPGKSVHPDADTFGFFVSFYFKEGKVEEALRWFEDMVNREGDNAPKVRVGSYNTVYKGLAETGRITEAMEMLKKMWEKGLKPDSMTYEILITASCNEGLLDQVRALVEEMVRIRVAHPPELRLLVSEAFNKEGRSEEVEKMFAPPRPVVPPAPQYLPPRPQQAYNRNPNWGARHPPYDGGSQFTHPVESPPPSYNAGTQFVHAGGPRPPYTAGNQFSHTGGPQPPYTAGNQFQHAGGLQSPRAPYRPEDVNTRGSSQFPGPQTTQFSSIIPSELGRGPQASHFATSYQTPNGSTSAHTQNFATQPYSSAGSQDANGMMPPNSEFRTSQFPGGTSQVPHTDYSQAAYMGNAQGWQGMPHQTNNSYQSVVAPHTSPFQVPREPVSSSYQARNFGDPQATANVAAQSSSTAGSDVPWSGPHVWNGGNPQRTHFSAPQHSPVGRFTSSSTLHTPPLQSGMASQAAPYAGHLPSTSGSPSSQEMNPATDNVSASQGSWSVPPQDWEDDYRLAELADGANRRF